MNFKNNKHDMQKCVSFYSLPTSVCVSPEKSIRSNQSISSLQSIKFANINQKSHLRNNQTPSQIVDTDELCITLDQNAIISSQIIERSKSFYKNKNSKQDFQPDKKKFVSQICIEMNQFRLKSSQSSQRGNILVQNLIQIEQKQKKEFQKQIDANSQIIDQEQVTNMHNNKVAKHIVNKQLQFKVKSQKISEIDEESSASNSTKQNQVNNMREMWQISNRNFQKIMQSNNLKFK